MSKILKVENLCSGYGELPVLDSVNIADIATKTTGSPDQLIAERLLLEISARARRLGL